MKLTNFGAIQVAITVNENNPELMTVTLGAEHRKEVLVNTTHKEETVDQFVMRLKSMMRALWNAEARTPAAEVAKTEVKKEQTWAEEKAQILGGPKK